MKRFIQWFYNRLIPTLLALAALVGLWLLGQQTERYAYDLFMRWSARPATDSPVTLVLIDDASIEKLKDRFGPLPWPRQTYLEIFQRVQSFEPALMVLDGHFINVNQSEDAEVFQAMRQFPNLITGLVMQEGPGPSATGLNTSISQYYRLNLGVVSMRQEADGSIRVLRPVYQVRANASQTGIFPALSLAAAYEYLSQKTQQTWLMDVNRRTNPNLPRLELYSEASPDRAIRLPLSAGDAFYLRYYRLMPVEPSEYKRSHKAVPLWRLFEDQDTAPVLKGRIALIGASSTFYRDYHPTPVALRHLGPDIHATAIDNILNGSAIRKAPAWVNLLVLGFLFMAVLLLRFRYRHLGLTLLYALGTMIIYCSLAYWFFSTHGLWLDVITPELFLIVAFLTGSTFRIIFKERQLATMERNLKQMLDPSVYQEIQRIGLLTPGGQKCEITSMFVDIRNFTRLSEHMAPSAITDMLNEFYAAVVRVVFDHRGTVDKFMGDGILLIFGAPIPDDEHRQMALNAAQDILHMVHTELAPHLKETRNIDLEVGISLNSGPAVAGWLGPASNNLHYTAVGDTVNTCVRLQEQTKQFHTRLILSETTVQALAPNHPDLVALGEIHVRGREAPVKIYTLQSALIETPAP